MSELDPATAPASSRRSVRFGIIDSGAVLIGLFPFAMVAGFAVNEAGFGVFEALGLALIVFAGAAHLAGLELFVSGAPLVVAVATMLMINARFAMYSAAMSQLMAGAPFGRRAAVAYCTTDQSYALMVGRMNDKSREKIVPWVYYVAVGATLAVVWSTAVVFGFYIGNAVPEVVPLTFAVPLTFISLAVPAVVNRPTLAAAITALIVAVVGTGLPANLGLLAGALTGIAVGTVLELRKGA